jgi:two-component system, NarL family, response regulator YdfI
MRVLLVGSTQGRARLRAQLAAAAIEVAAEFATLGLARAADIEVDGILVAPEPPADDDPFHEALTRREVEVLELLAEGLPNKSIAARLRISDQTVKFHVASISGKLGAANRTDVVRRAVRRGLLTL